MTSNPYPSGIDYKTPWCIGRNPAGTLMICDSEGQNIEFGEGKLAKAEHVVECVNSHDRLQALARPEVCDDCGEKRPMYGKQVVGHGLYQWSYVCEDCYNGEIYRTLSLMNDKQSQLAALVQNPDGSDGVLVEALTNTTNALDFAFQIIGDDKVMQVCIDPWGTLKDAMEALATARKAMEETT